MTTRVNRGYEAVTPHEQAVREVVKGLGGTARNVRGDNREFGDKSRVRAGANGLDDEAVDALCGDGVVVEIRNREWFVTAIDIGGSDWEFRARRAPRTAESAVRLD